MNCLEFRRIKRAEPARMNNEMVAHARNCAGCAAFVVRWQAFEAELSAAARIPVDDGLARRIVLNHRLGRHAAGSFRKCGRRLADNGAQSGACHRVG